MEKFLKIIIINLIFFILFLVVIDYVFFKFICISYLTSVDNKENKLINPSSEVRYNAFDIPKNDTSTTNVYSIFLEKKYYNDVVIPENNKNLKPPVILFGDSYVWIHSDDGLPKLLAKYTSRPIFNFAFWGWGTQHMYYLAQKELLYKIIDDNSSSQPEYAVYTYIRDHKNRLFPVMDCFGDISPYLTYKIKNDSLEIKKYSFFHKIIFRLFAYRYIMSKSRRHDNILAYEMLYKLIVETQKELQKHYPNIKFVVLVYHQDNDFIPSESNMFNKLKKNGIMVINTRELTKEDLLNKKYVEYDKYHPNVSAWKLITPLFAKHLM